MVATASELEAPPAVVTAPAGADVAGVSLLVSSLSSLHATVALRSSARAGTARRYFGLSFMNSYVPGTPADIRSLALRCRVSEQLRRRSCGSAPRSSAREHVERSNANATDLDRPFLEWITTNVWGDLWADPTLDRKTRSMITIAILAALGRDELALHLRASVGTGVSDAELAQVLQHVAVYAGVPAANHAFQAAKAARAR